MYKKPKKDKRVVNTYFVSFDQHGWYIYTRRMITTFWDLDLCEKTAYPTVETIVHDYMKAWPILPHLLT